MAPLIIIYLEGYVYGKMSIRVDGYREGGTIPQSDEGRKTEVGSAPERYIWRREMK